MFLFASLLNPQGLVFFSCFVYGVGRALWQVQQCHGTDNLPAAGLRRRWVRRGGPGAPAGAGAGSAADVPAARAGKRGDVNANRSNVQHFASCLVARWSSARRELSGSFRRRVENWVNPCPPAPPAYPYLLPSLAVQPHFYVSG